MNHSSYESLHFAGVHIINALQFTNLRFISADNILGQYNQRKEISNMNQDLSI